jgi:hypothetical protein
MIVILALGISPQELLREIPYTEAAAGQCRGRRAAAGYYHGRGRGRGRLPSVAVAFAATAQQHRAAARPRRQAVAGAAAVADALRRRRACRLVAAPRRPGDLPAPRPGTNLGRAAHRARRRQEAGAVVDQREVHPADPRADPRGRGGRRADNRASPDTGCAPGLKQAYKARRGCSRVSARQTTSG